MINCSTSVPYSAGRRFEPVCTTNRHHVDALILAELTQLAPTRVLDVGCANGRFARALRDAHVVGIELDEELASRAAEVCNEVIVGDVELAETLRHSQMHAPYDAILALDLIEHLVRPEATLRAFTQLLAPDGRIVLNVPNLLYYRERLRLLAGRFDTSPVGGLYDVTHLHFFSLRELERLLDRAGLAVERLIGAGNVRPGRRVALWPLPVRFGHWLASALVHLAAQIRPQLFARSFVVVAEPKRGDACR